MAYGSKGSGRGSGKQGGSSRSGGKGYGGSGKAGSASGRGSSQSRGGSQGRGASQHHGGSQGYQAKKYSGGSGARDGERKGGYGAGERKGGYRDGEHKGGYGHAAGGKGGYRTGERKGASSGRGYAGSKASGQNKGASRGGKGAYASHGAGASAQHPAEIRIQKQAKRDAREAAKHKNPPAAYDKEASTYDWSRFESPEARNAGEGGGEGRDNRGARDERDGRDNRDSRDGRSNRNDRDNRGGRDGRDNHDNRGGRDARGNQQGRDRRDGRGGHDSRDGRDNRGDRDDRDRHSGRDDRDRRDSRTARDDRDGRGNRGDRGPRDNRGGRGKREVVLSPARQAACAIGREVRERTAYVAEVTPGVLARFPGISPEDAAFATKLSRGVMATLGTLDEFIDRNLRSPDDIQPDVRDAMRVSAYELVFLDKAPYAVVDQGVELVCSVAPHAGGLANAVLRRMAESAKAFPFGNPNLSLEVLARSQAFPLWLAKRLMSEMGLSKATAFMKASNADATVYAAINANRVSDDEEVEDIFDQAGTLLTKSSLAPGCYRIHEARALRNPEVRALLDGGKICISDESAQAIAALALGDEEPGSFLEIGGGRGTKTILVQSDAMRAFGHCVPLTTVDDHAFKGDILTKRCELYGISCDVTSVTADAREISQVLEPESFDAVLVDAPCTGVGTMRRHPEIRWRLAPEDIDATAENNLALLSEAARMVAPSGVLTYATCTVFAAENEDVLERFLASEAGEGFVIDKTITTTLSAIGPDAHYACRLRRAVPGEEIVEEPFDFDGEVEVEDEPGAAGEFEPAYDAESEDAAGLESGIASEDDAELESDTESEDDVESEDDAEPENDADLEPDASQKALEEGLEENLS